MGAGIAKQIRYKYPEAYKEYRQCCDLYTPEELLGMVLVVPAKNKIIANIFGQINCGKNKEQHTSYEALMKGFLYLNTYADKYGYDIAIPYGIGCGLGGGDWNVVYEIIQKNINLCDVYLYKI